MNVDDDDFAKLVDDYPPPADAGLSDGKPEGRHIGEAPPPGYRLVGESRQNSSRRERKGATETQKIDLHGLTEGEALDKLAEFLRLARHGSKEVRVEINHGKGNNSKHGQVLGPAVQKWLDSKSAREAGVHNWWTGDFSAGGKGITHCIIKPRSFPGGS